MQESTHLYESVTAVSFLGRAACGNAETRGWPRVSAGTEAAGSTVHAAGDATLGSPEYRPHLQQYTCCELWAA